MNENKNRPTLSTFWNKGFFARPKWVDSDQRFSKGGLGLPVDGDVSWRHSFCTQKLTQKFGSYRPKTDLKSRHVPAPHLCLRNVPSPNRPKISKLCRRNVRYFYRRNVPSPNRPKISKLCRRNVRYFYRRKVASPNRPIAESSSRLDFHRRIGVAESYVAESASPKRPIPFMVR